MSEYRTPADTNANDDEQSREHTGLRTLDGHLSAREVYRALHCPYAGTRVLDEKQRLRFDASSERVKSSGMRAEACASGSRDRSGERGASL